MGLAFLHCDIWDLSSKGGGKQQLHVQIRAGKRFCVFMGLGFEVRKGNRAGYGISIVFVTS